MRTLLLVVAIALPTACASPHGGGAPADPVIPLWGLFEQVAPNDGSYADPYRDVSLDVRYTRPDGSTVDFWGFYGGDGMWRFRFMPDQVGTWSYASGFSDGTPGPAGLFETVPSDLPGAVRVYGPNPVWFAFGGDAPVQLRSFHVGDRFFARNWDDPSDPADGDPRAAFLDWAGDQGYNMLSIASHYLNRDDENRGRGWDTPRLWPLDAAEYDRMETILEDLAERRMVVFPFAGFFGRASEYPTEAADQELYIRYTLARIAPYWNLLLNVAGPEPGQGVGMHGELPMSEADVHRLGRQIRELDVFDHPITVHNRPGDDPYRDSEWTDYITLQGWKHRDWDEIHAGMMRNHTGTKPVYAQEVFWPGNTIGHGEFTPDEIRRKAFVLKMAAATINFADMQGHSSSGFSGTLDLSQKNQTRHDIIRSVWDFFETIPFYRMRPRPGLASRGFALAEEGERYLVYLPEGGPVDVRLDGRPHSVTWIDPRRTVDRRDGETTTTGRDLRSPSDGDDWLLYLEARSD
jgi:hypothetical protein